jgi:hypothetical protein
VSGRERQFPVKLNRGAELLVKRLLQDGEPVPMSELLDCGDNPEQMMNVLAWLSKRAETIEVSGACYWGGGRPTRFVVDPAQATVRVTDQAGLAALLRIWPRVPPSRPARLQLVRPGATVTGSASASAVTGSRHGVA